MTLFQVQKARDEGLNTHDLQVKNLRKCGHGQQSHEGLIWLLCDRAFRIASSSSDTSGYSTECLLIATPI
jgi:hypothetical protein